MEYKPSTRILSKIREVKVKQRKMLFCLFIFQEYMCIYYLYVAVEKN